MRSIHSEKFLDSYVFYALSPVLSPPHFRPRWRSSVLRTSMPRCASSCADWALLTISVLCVLSPCQQFCEGFLFLVLDFSPSYSIKKRNTRLGCNCCWVVEQFFPYFSGYCFFIILQNILHYGNINTICGHCMPIWNPYRRLVTSTRPRLSVL